MGFTNIHFLWTKILCAACEICTSNIIYNICLLLLPQIVSIHVRGTVGKCPDCSCCVICFQGRKLKLCTLVGKNIFLHNNIYI